MTDDIKVPNTDKSEEHKLEPAELAVAEKVGGLLSQGYTRDAKLSYTIGAHIVGLKGSDEKYGQGSVERVAKKVGCTAALLYRHARVPDAWSKATFEKELANASATGLPLTFSHFAEIARLQDKQDGEKRAALLAEARRGSLSVRDLAKKVRDGRPDAPLTGRRVLGRLVASCNKMLERTKADFESLNTVDVTGGSVKQLELTLETYTAMRVTVEQVQRRLGELLVQAKKPKTAEETAPSPPDPPESEPEPPESAASRPGLEAMHRLVAR
jgi:hypothetical protein